MSAMPYHVRGIIGGLRNATAEGVVSSLNDSGQAMTVNLSTGDGVNRADVEVASPWGFSSNPPADGMLTLVFAVGGDPSNLRAMHPHNPSARFGSLEVGEAAIYGADGSRVHIRNGSIEIWSANIEIYGNVSVNGKLTATGNITAGQGTGDQVDLRTHTHDYIPGTGAATPTSAPIAGT
jgi:phage gp45-like